MSIEKVKAYLEEGIFEVGTYDVEITGDNTANLTLNSTAELEEGDYVVWIPEEYFLFDGKESADIKVYYDDVKIKYSVAYNSAKLYANVCKI